MRTFIAVELSPAVRRPLVELLRRAPRHPGVRWVTEPQLHVTLKFLGEVPDAQLPPVIAAATAAAAGVAPFTIRVQGLGAFPSPRAPRVLWCGVEDSAGGCRKWVERADPLLDRLGYPPEQRAFTPHITLARSRDPGGAAELRQALEQTPPPRTDELTVDHVVVFESILAPTGARYRVVATVPLGPG